MLKDQSDRKRAKRLCHKKINPKKTAHLTLTSRLAQNSTFSITYKPKNAIYYTLNV